MRARLIVNPKSGTDRAPTVLPEVNERLRTLVDELDITLTTGPEDVITAAGRAVRDGCDVLFVAGGDGTINAAVRGIAAVPGGFERIAIGVIPAGTGNDFAKALDLGEDAEGALERLLAARVVQVDLGTLNGRPFFNTSAGGFVADVSATMTEEMKDRLGKLAYLVGGARALFDTEPFAASVSLRGEDARLNNGPVGLQMFAVANARFIGGGYPIAPGAIIDDGLLDVFLVREAGLVEFVALLQLIAAGEHAADERIVHFRAGEFTLEFNRGVRVNTDGEALEAARCEYRVLPRAARFLCGPRPLTTAEPRPLVVK